MNKNITAIILIVLAVVAVWWGWGKLQPYFNTGGDVPADGQMMPHDPAMPGGAQPTPQP